MAEDPPSASPFPAVPEAAGAERAQLRPRPTVLLVDDDSTDVLVIREVLERCGLNFRVEVARNGQAAVMYLEELARGQLKAPPALILLDLNLPKIPGLELLQIIRSDSRWRQVPVIIVTSSQAESDRSAAERFGANAYFQKPTDLDEYQLLAELVRGICAPAGEAGEPS